MQLVERGLVEELHVRGRRRLRLAEGGWRLVHALRAGEHARHRAAVGELVWPPTAVIVAPATLRGDRCSAQAAWWYTIAGYQAIRMSDLSVIIGGELDVLPGHRRRLMSRLADMVSGAILAAIVRRAKERAIERTLQGDPSSGITAEDLLEALNDEYREGEVLPPDDAAEEWLKLLDHHPEQVVGISSFRRGRQAEERLVGQIV